MGWLDNLAQNGNHQLQVNIHLRKLGAACGWRARLQLKLQHDGSKTRIVHRVHEGPLLVQRAFYPEGESPCHVYIIHPPGGVAGGDELDLEAELQWGAHALLTTPAAAKFYRRGGGGTARVTQVLRANGATLEWLPQENIFYPDAAVELSSIVHLSGACRFMGWEIACLGLPASGLTLGTGELRLGIELWKNGEPLLLERLSVAGAVLTAPWGMAGRSAFGSALCYPATVRELDAARACIAMNCAGLPVACTLVDEVLICRAIAERGDQLKKSFVGLWQVLRPLLLGRAAVPPRIWAT